MDTLLLDEDQLLAQKFDVLDKDPESLVTPVDLADDDNDFDSLFEPKASHGQRKFAKEEKKIKESNETIISRHVFRTKNYIDSIVDENEKAQKRTEVIGWVNEVALDILAVDESRILYKEIKVKDGITQKQIGTKCQFVFTPASIIYEWDQNSKVDVKDARENLILDVKTIARAWKKTSPEFRQSQLCMLQGEIS